MNKKHIAAAGIVGLIVLSVIIGILLKKSSSDEVPTTEATTVLITTEPTENTTETEEVETTEGIKYDSHYNPYTGLYTDSELTDRRPIVVMLDNQYLARPQAGLDEADVVYEILAEGLITRYMAVFYGELPDHVGPVRSSRPYFVEKAYEYDPYYVHVGGSMQALSDIRKYALADIDGLTSGAFWRENHKTIPHNMYTSSESLIKDGNRLGYKTAITPNFIKFNEAFKALNGSNANEITFVYKDPVKTDPTGYYTSYIYNDEEKVYYRYTNGTPHKDEDSKTQLTCTNILVQYAKTVVIDNEGRLDIDLITSGTGKYYTGGKFIEVTWSKKSADALTEFFDLDGQPIQLNPGKTWIQVMKIGREEIIK